MVVTVDTDALRALAIDQKAAPDHWDQEDWIDWERDAANALIASADELDRLRAVIAEVRDVLNRNTWPLRWEDVQEARRLLLALVPDLPKQHAPGCAAWQAAHQLCDCWKSRIEAAR